MKCTIPEISWHNREPVLSVDIFPENRNFYRLASGGGDCHVLIWQMNITKIGAVNQEVISDLTRHQRAVNCVRWSNTGQYLASGDDDANIIVWQLKTDNIPLLEGDTGDKEIWNVYKVMRGHKEDVYDLCWSMDATKILSGSVDNTAILWDVNKGKMDHILTDHKGFVQGVSWDPKNQIIATISTDRMCRIFDPIGKQIKARIHKGKLSVPETHYLHDKEVKFFHDDTFKSFFRRLQFTPDGSLLIVPSGHLEADSDKSPLNATLIFTLDNFSSPAVILPLPHQSSTVVRCCPLLFQLHENGPDSLIKLPYRMVFAVGTDHDIILYDTQQAFPFARFQDIHYTRLTDLTWSYDGLLLVASSTDGFCSLITFEMDELGIPWEKMDSGGEENPLDISGCEELVVKDENVDTNNKEISVEEKIKVQEDAKKESKKRPSFLEQWALQKPKKKRIDLEEPKLVNSPEKEDVKSGEVQKIDVPVNILIPRRIPIDKEKINTKEMKKESSTKPEEKINVLIPKRKPEKNVPKTEEKVNILIPRRIEAKRVEPTASTSTVEASCSTQKQIKSKNIKKVGQDSDEDSSDSEAEALSKEELEELHKASENIREFFCRVPKKQGSDIKSIAARRKPMESTGNGSKQDNNANKHSEAKVIEVRRKPRLPAPSQPKKTEEEPVVKEQFDAQPMKSNKDQKIDSGTEHSLSKDATEKEPKKTDKDHKTESGTIHSLPKDAKPIAVKRKPRDLKAETRRSDKPEKVHTTQANKNGSSSVIATEMTSSPDVICIVDSDDEKDKTTPKKLKSDPSKQSNKGPKDRPPKIKVSSLVKTRKSDEKTPKKTNALLNFLQKSVEKKTKKKDNKEVIYIEEETEARDAWKCDSKRREEQSNKTDGETDRTVPLDEDVTEDFCLQLEDSQEACDEKKIDYRSSEKIGLSSERTVSMPRTPKRVPLITLASPKGKTNKTK